jgi:phosphotransferase system HPr-like phosphotransfer protein
MMQVLMLAAPQGSRLTFRATGADAEEAVAALVALAARGFDEMDEADKALVEGGEQS